MFSVLLVIIDFRGHCGSSMAFLMNCLLIKLQNNLAWRHFPEALWNMNILPSLSAYK